MSHTFIQLQHQGFWSLEEDVFATPVGKTRALQYNYMFKFCLPIMGKKNPKKRRAGQWKDFCQVCFWKQTPNFTAGRPIKVTNLPVCPHSLLTGICYHPVWFMVIYVGPVKTTQFLWLWWSSSALQVWGGDEDPHIQYIYCICTHTHTFSQVSCELCNEKRHPCAALCCQSSDSSKAQSYRGWQTFDKSEICYSL